jgi:lipopolysaccharide/colanic/teichoic acid biosynthesis glycosyltransferase
VYRNYLKRLFDIAASAGALLVFSPLFLIRGLFIRQKLGTPIFFSQSRPGLNGRPFVLVKFRTMADLYDEDGNLLADDMRLTSFGRWLRSTSLDELPELLNVMRGDMSLVGPRPLLLRYLNRYTATQRRRHELRPGITGWAQIHGRNTLSWEERFELDVWYVDHCSFLIDMKVLIKTIHKVIRREGINEAGQATMSEFMGSG